MEIQIQDVKKGDEIIVSGPRGKLIYIKVLAPCKVAKNQGFYPKYSRIKYSGIRGTTRIEEKIRGTTRIKEKKYSYTWNGSTRKWTRKNPVCTPDEHNVTKSFDLNNKTIWLVKRENLEL